MADRKIRFSDGQNQVDVKAIDIGGGVFALATVATPPSVATSVKLSPHGGSKTVTTAGTGEALVATSTPAKSVVIIAKNGNTDDVCIGDSGVDKTTSRQVVRTAGQSVSITAEPGYYIDLHEIYVDVDVNGEGVDFIYLA